VPPIRELPNNLALARIHHTENIGKTMLSDMLEGREKISGVLQKFIDERTESWKSSRGTQSAARIAIQLCAAKTKKAHLLSSFRKDH
jgi:hypothetical protein